MNARCFIAMSSYSELQQIPPRQYQGILFVITKASNHI